jgi:3-oxoacyl-[acyl-carrier protein] reductase
MDLKGAVALVTGAGSGLGEHVARVLAHAGSHVVVADRDESAAVAVTGGLRAEELDATPIACDVTRDVDLRSAVAVAESLGGVDLLVNNAGGWGGTSEQYPEASAGDWSAVLDLNLRAPMLALQLCLPGMRRRGRGAVVNVSSSAGVERTAYASPPYAVAKAGLVRLTTSLAGLGSEGIRVTCVVPGWVGLERAHTQRAALDEAERARTPALVPPALIADTILHLVRDDVAAGTVVELLDGDRVTMQSPGDSGT